MKSTGMVRQVDQLGRVVIPIELRRNLGIEERDPLEIFVDGENVVLKKYKPHMQCAVTGEVSENNYRLLDGKLILSPSGLEKLLEEIEK